MRQIRTQLSVSIIFTHYNELCFTDAPTVAPVISGYTSQSPLHEGDILNIACQVTGGKPLVSHVKFVCHGADVQGWEKRDELGVTRSIQFMVLKTHHGKVCGCSAQHVTGKYDLASMVTLVVNCE